MDKLQDTFVRALLKLPLSTPKASLRAAFGLLGMAWWVKAAKVLMVMSIRGQEEGGLAREVLEEHLPWASLGWAKRSHRFVRRWGYQMPQGRKLKRRR